MALPDEEKIPENEQAEHEEHPTEIPEPEGDEASQGEAVDSEQNAAEGLQKVLEEVEKYKDAALRAEAEMQNMQRRTARDVENAHKFALEKFLQNLLPVVDSMEKAVEAAEQASENEDDAMLEGIRLCHKLLVDVLGKEGIEVIDPMGEPFDPNEHQAMSMVENPDMEPNSVFAVVQKGYRLNGRLVRAAMVMVTKAPAATEEDS
ncbi:MAG: nucleotide exchange factor GrpE [Pseudomonadales bacterium]|nr:nucleotide exchange factor GrpE [Pseudomonadales bacterium]MBO6597447.1 nucleotide exchange factor GrpE [Pseudomonadales bacterium]MBO6824181.1 nucleotide exchange factor GrpE [Pseudomonadales bacterium]